MALYTFSVRRKGTNEYVRAHIKHELQFLDFFAMQFNNKKELIKFLGANPEKYDDIQISYQNNRKTKFLPVYFDAPELEDICINMLDFTDAVECKNIYEALALAYQHNGFIKPLKKVPDIKATNEIIWHILYDKRPIVAASNKHINQKALEYYEKGFYVMFRNELMRSYIEIRKAYVELRENGHILWQERKREIPSQTMQELVDSYFENHDRTSKIVKIYKILQKLSLTPYEETLVVRILADDENAYEELMASDIERLDYLKTLLDYLAEERENVKKIGPID